MADNERYDGLGPLPGGVTSYFDSALAILAEVQANAPSTDELLDFLRRQYGVEGKVAGDGYLSLLRRLGWLQIADGAVAITTRGTALLATGDRDLAYDDLASTYSGVSEVIDLVEKGITTPANLRDSLNERLGTHWQTANQASFRLNWLRSLGKISEAALRNEPTSTSNAASERVAPDCERVIERLHPDGVVRGRALQWLASAIDRAHGEGAARWVLSLRSGNRLHLSVGMMLVLALARDNVWISLDEATLTAEQRASLDAHGKRDPFVFTAVSGIVCYDLPITVLPAVEDAIRPAFEECIRRAAASVARTPFYKGFSEALLAVVERRVGVTLPRPDYGPSSGSREPTEAPTLDPADLPAWFAAFRADPFSRLIVAVRRRRAAEIRALLAKPDELDVETFHREVWHLERRTLHGTVDLTGAIFNEAEPLSADQAESLREAVLRGELTLVGNYVWRQASGIVAPTLADPVERLAIVREAARILTDASRSPHAKALALLELKGFGENTATGLVLLFHPTEYALCNKVSAGVVASLGMSADDLDDFQQSALALKTQLGAEDYLELDHFLWCTSTGRYVSRTDSRPERATGVSIVKIAPGTEARFWSECLAEGMMCLGWDDVGDLRAFGTREEFLTAFELHFSKRYKGHRAAVIQAANELWSILRLKAGDRVIANKGKREILGVGEVVAPGYVWRPERAQYRHTIAVRWDVSRARKIDEQPRWFRTIVWLDPAQWHAEAGVAEPVKTEEKRGTDVLVPEEVVAPLPSLEAIHARIAEEGMRIDARTLRRYHVALQVRKFVILAGVSGTGKTWLAQAYAEAVGAEYRVIPVAPDWSSDHDLLGYEHPLRKDYVHTDFSRLLGAAAGEWAAANAAGRRARPFHAILDEMNLARVEQYFARFLSAMEMRAREGEVTLSLAGGRTEVLTPNLYFIGTVNVDETIHGFADKVYDRAQLIEIPAPRKLIAEHLSDREYSALLLRVWDAAVGVAPFAYRTLDDIAGYVDESVQLGATWQEAIDEQILQKVLPRVKGNDGRVEQCLQALRALATEHGLALTLARVDAMIDRWRLHGFTSYF